MNKIKSQPYFKWPQPMGSDHAKSKADLHCSYQKDHDHKTENCQTLKQFLEDPMEEGHLEEIVKKTCNTTEPPAKKNESKQRVVGLITAIHGALHKSKASKKTIRYGFIKLRCLRRRSRPRLCQSWQMKEAAKKPFTS